MAITVIDASVAIAGLAPDEGHENSRNLIDRIMLDGAVVPALWPFEVANIVALKFRRGLLSKDARDLMLRSLKDLSLQLLIESSDPNSAIFDATFDLSSAYSLTFYDAAYLELALRRALPLATLDRALATAARQENVALI